MIRLTQYLTVTCAMSLVGGCSLPPADVVADEAANFCDVEQPRRFTQAEVDWRAENAPANLRLDFKTNTTFERECEGVDQ
jgi:hypothetical protein